MESDHPESFHSSSGDVDVASQRRESSIPRRPIVRHFMGHHLSAEQLLSWVTWFKKKDNNNPYRFHLLGVVFEIFTSWVAAILLGVYLGFCYVVSTKRKNDNTTIQPLLFVPLTTTSRNQDITLENALEKLKASLESIIHKKKDLSAFSSSAAADDDDAYDDSKKRWRNEEELIDLMRSSVEARRFASLVMMKQLQVKKQEKAPDEHDILIQQLQRIWPKLLELPPPHTDNDYDDDDQQQQQHQQQTNYTFDISLVVPAYFEKGINIQSNLRRALLSCCLPSKVQVVLVDAGRNENIECALQQQQQQVEVVGDDNDDDIKNDDHGNDNKTNKVKKWGDTKLVTYSGGGGRGPTMNYGANNSDGSVLTFLHSDNILPEGWDETIMSLLSDRRRRGNDSDSVQKTTTTTTTTKRSIACAFSFRINTSQEALGGLGGGCCPPGLAAAQCLGTIRTRYFHALYGDSVLSIRKSIFRYVGGYPEQALMEDYEMMDLLRKRVASSQGELPIHSSETLISPRRWQKNGVTYVILFNFLCVYLYENRGWSPEKLYNFYYQRPSR